jgi:hypothetical protein
MSLLSTTRALSLALVVTLAASGAAAQSIYDGGGPLDLDRLPPTTIVPSEAAGGATLQRVFGHINSVGTSDPTLDGIGFIDVPEELPMDALILATNVASNPLPYSQLTPRGGTLGPEGLYYFLGTANDGIEEIALYTLDPDNPGADYVLVSDGLEDALLAVGTEFPVGLGYNADTGEAVLATNLCAEVEGVYYQSFLYEFDLETGAVGARLELRDPNAPTAEDDGVCLFSASWEEGGAVFGADSGGDIVELDAGTGLLSERYPAVTLPGEVIQRVQSATFDAERGEHLVFPFSLEFDGNEVVAAFSRAFVCTSAAGCEFRGFVADNIGDQFYTVEMLTSAVLPKLTPSVGAGAQPGAAAMAVYPNPFASTASVELRLDRPESVTVTVHDLLGRTVAVLFDGQAAQLDLALDATDLPSSVYIVRAQGETFSTVRKVVVAR